MPRHPEYPNYWPWRPGDAWGICDVCGFRFYQSELKKRWDGLMTCEKDWEIRHPQDTIKSVKEKIYVENARPEAPDTFLEVGEVTADDL